MHHSLTGQTLGAAAGEPPVYIGFGSLLVDNPRGLTSLVLGAARRSGPAHHPVQVHVLHCHESIRPDLGEDQAQSLFQVLVSSSIPCVRLLTDSSSVPCSGWGGLGADAEVPESVLLLEAAPHDWLLPRCSAVVHHGGAGGVPGPDTFQIKGSAANEMRLPWFQAQRASAQAPQQRA